MEQKREKPSDPSTRLRRRCTMSTNAKTVSRYATKPLILVGLFGALSTILMLLEFSLPFIPPFVKMDFYNRNIRPI